MKSIIVQAEDAQLSHVNDFIHSFLPADCNAGVVNQIDVAAEEIFVNIAHYAYPQKDGTAEISCDVENDVLTVTFADEGTPFNPLERPDPDITLSAEDRKIGGLGIYLTKKFMDSVSYVYEDGKNRLTFSKRIHG